MADEIVDQGRVNLEELADVFRKLDERKCRVMLTNSNTYLVRELYPLLQGILRKLTQKGLLTVRHQKEKVIRI
jgi:site-specific DNA-adenine methylase